MDKIKKDKILVFLDIADSQPAWGHRYNQKMFFIVSILVFLMPTEVHSAQLKTPSGYPTFLLRSYSSTPILLDTTSVTRLNDMSNLEAAGSVGPSGLELGAGGTSLRLSHSNGARTLLQELVQSQLDPTGATTNNKNRAEIPDELFIPKIWITKGIAWPFDIGLSYGHEANHDISILNTYIQWTAFQTFGLPALSLQGDYIRTKLRDILTVQSLGALSKLSWGYGVLTVYGSMGLQRNKIQFEELSTSASASSTDSPALTSHSALDELSNTSATSWSSSYTAGIRVQIPLTMWTIVLERALNTSNRRVTGKISFSF